MKQVQLRPTERIDDLLTYDLKIIQSDEISASIDLFRCGILIFNNDIKTKYRLQLRINITK